MNSCFGALIVDLAGVTLVRITGEREADLVGVLETCSCSIISGVALKGTVSEAFITMFLEAFGK